VIGGVAAVAHHAGKNSGEAQAEQQAAQQQAAQPAYAPPPPAQEVGSDDMVAQLTNLKKLLDDGVLTQAEFDAQKQKILASS
jgi:hypothetical protein